MDKLNVLYTTDSKFFPNMLTSIYSLLENNKDIYINIHIIESNLTKEQKTLLDTLLDLYNNCNLNIYNIKYMQKYIDLFNLPKWRNTDIANARLFASEFINEDKVLYLDSDTLIVNSLKDILNVNTNAPISAVKEIYVPNHLKDYLNCYYNSGVLYFNYETWNKDNYLQKLYNTLNNIKTELIFPDQDLLNLTINKNINTLDMSYNILTYIYLYNKYSFSRNKFFKNNENYYKEDEIYDSLNNPHILHMLEYFYTKPWNKNKIHPFNDIYKEYRTIWDKEFKQEENNNILAQIKLLSYINMLMKCTLSDKMNESIKSKVKTILKP